MCDCSLLASSWVEFDIIKRLPNRAHKRNRKQEEWIKGPSNSTHPEWIWSWTIVVLDFGRMPTLIKSPYLFPVLAKQPRLLIWNTQQKGNALKRRKTVVTKHPNSIRRYNVRSCCLPWRPIFLILRMYSRETTEMRHMHVNDPKTIGSTIDRANFSLL